MKRRFIFALLACVLVAGAQALAHHSFAATYLEDQSVTIEGEIVQFLLRNPHSFVHVMVKQPDGTSARYVVEWGSPAQLSGRVTEGFVVIMKRKLQALDRAADVHRLALIHQVADGRV